MVVVFLFYNCNEFNNNTMSCLTFKQRKFRESDEEESYFNDDSIDSAAVLSQKTLPAGGVMPLIENVTSLQS